MILRDSAKIVRNSTRILRDSAKIVRNSARILRNSTKIVRNSSKIVGESAKIVQNSAKIVQNSIPQKPLALVLEAEPLVKMVGRSASDVTNHQLVSTRKEFSRNSGRIFRIVGSPLTDHRGSTGVYRGFTNTS